MPADLSLSQADAEDLGISLVAGLLSAVQADGLLAHVKAEPSRLAAARAEGVREGIEMARQAASAARLDVGAGDRSWAEGWIAGCDGMQAAIIADIDVLAPAPAWTPTHRHYKGGLYRVTARSIWSANDAHNGRVVVHYDNERGERFSMFGEDWRGQVSLGDGATSVRRYEPIAPAPAEAPGHTDLMVTPESLDAFLEKNPPPTEAPTTPTVEASSRCLRCNGSGIGRETMLCIRCGGSGEDPHSLSSQQTVQPAEASAPVVEGE